MPQVSAEPELSAAVDRAFNVVGLVIAGLTVLSWALEAWPAFYVGLVVCLAYGVLWLLLGRKP